MQIGVSGQQASTFGVTICCDQTNAALTKACIVTAGCKSASSTTRSTYFVQELLPFMLILLTTSSWLV
jgi:hypothetical protein